MDKYEYKLIKSNTLNIVNDLNKYSEEGWHQICIDSYKENDKVWSDTVYKVLLERLCN